MEIEHTGEFRWQPWFEDQGGRQTIGLFETQRCVESTGALQEAHPAVGWIKRSIPFLPFWDVYTDRDELKLIHVLVLFSWRAKKLLLEALKEHP